MTPRLLQHATTLIEEALRFQAPADEVARQYMSRHRELGARDRGLLGDVLFSVLRRLAVLKHQARGGPGDMAQRLAILAWPLDQPFAAQALDEGRRQWRSAALAIAVDGLPAATRLNLPPWLHDALQAELGDELPALVQALDRPATLDLRVNTQRAKRAQVQRSLAEAGWPAQNTPYAPHGLRLEGRPDLHKWSGWSEGLVDVQDEGSQLLALLVDARRGETVVDFCAGAGGKTLALGASMRNTGQLYAFDTSGHRLAALKPRLMRAGLTQVYTTQIAHERDARVARLHGKVDRVLVDAPCSGLGTLRRSPDLKWRHALPDIEAFAKTQQAILSAAADLLKPGGRLVYATCSLLAAENQAVAQAFTATHRDFEPLEAAPVLERAGVEQVPTLVERPYMRLLPHRHDTDGFFAALWQRRA